MHYFLDIKHSVSRIWSRYRTYVEESIQAPLPAQSNDVEYLSNRLFMQGILYGIPAGIIAVVPTFCVAMAQGRPFLAWFGVFSVAAVCFFSLHSGLSVQSRKLVVSGALILTAIVLTISRGTFGIGSIYLLTFSVFYALHFSGRSAKLAVWVNVSVCALIVLIIALKPLPGNILNTFSVEDWMIASINFLFLNVVIVAMIRQTIARLGKTLETEAEIQQKLKNELKEKESLHLSLKESESRYRTLFSQSPSAKLIFDPDTLRFLETNEAATQVYGYSAEEFLQMKLTDIHDPSAIPALLVHIADERSHEGPFELLRSQHLRKNSAQIEVEILRSRIEIDGKPARLIVVNDISLQVQQVKDIRKQNAKLTEIAFTQSHLVRHPLTKIMALNDLIASEFEGRADQELLSAMASSTSELDKLIQKVVRDSAAILDK